MYINIYIYKYIYKYVYIHVRTGLTNSKALVEIPTPHKTTKVKEAKTNPTRVLSISNMCINIYVYI
jgi:hypothetical protein